MTTTSSSSRRQALCVTTSKPTASLTPGAGGGSCVMVCPQTGSILSSMRIGGDNSSRKALLGISTLSLFPSHFNSSSSSSSSTSSQQGGGGSSSSSSSLAMAYGGMTTKRDDTYGMLLTVRNNVSLPPICNWKVRLPESNMSAAGLLVSPCGHYIIGGAQSGNIFIWSALGGTLLRIVKAHYRPVRAMEWSNNGEYLITGGTDNMIHVFSLMDLVDHHHQASTTQTVSPIRSWSVHQLAITAIQVLPDGDRFISTSHDGQIVWMELHSDKILAKIQMEVGIESLTFHEGRLYAGSVQGTIYIIDLDVHAMHQTTLTDMTVVRRNKRQREETTRLDAVFGGDNNVDLESSDCYKAELRGHDKPITAMTVVMVDQQQALLVSGDESGILRVWDIASRGCIRIIQPWSQSVRSTTDSKTTNSNNNNDSRAVHPVTSIVVVDIDDGGERSNVSRKDKSNGGGIVNLLTPLKRFIKDSDGGNENGDLNIAVPFLNPYRGPDSLLLQSPCQIVVNDSQQACGDGTTTSELDALKTELEEAKKKIRILEGEA